VAVVLAGFVASRTRAELRSFEYRFGPRGRQPTRTLARTIAAVINPMLSTFSRAGVNQRGRIPAA
jgi:hypothetical protein